MREKIRMNHTFEGVRFTKSPILVDEEGYVTYPKNSWAVTIHDGEPD
jgi:hypothetical protein